MKNDIGIDFSSNNRLQNNVSIGSKFDKEHSPLRQEEIDEINNMRE